MIKTSIYFIVFIGIGFYATAQPALVEYTENVAYFNPAATANQSNDSLKITSFHRNQWVGVNGNPKHVIGFAEYNLSKINSGIGLSFCNERIGLNTTMELGLSYRYSLKFKNERSLSAGISLDYYQLGIKGTFITPSSSFYVNSSDAKLTSRAGLFYSSKSLAISASVFYPNEPAFRIEDFSSNYKMRRIYNFMGTYRFKLNPNNSLAPELVVFGNSNFLLPMFNLKWRRTEKMNLSIGFKGVPIPNSLISTNTSFGYQVFKKLYLGVAYENNLGFSTWFRHTFEVMVRFEIKKRAPKG